MRSRYLEQTDDRDKVLIENQLNRFLLPARARAEAYPDLKASEQFQGPSTRLTELESGIADRREQYNDGVTRHNEYIQLFPPLLVAKPFSYRDRPLLETSVQAGRAIRVGERL